MRAFAPGTEGDVFPRECLLMNDNFVYFTLTMDEKFVRIGYTGAGQRVEDHEAYGQKLLAKIPATKTNENSIHNHFSGSRADCFGTSKSHYHAEAVLPYAQGLVERGFATTNKLHAPSLPRVPWSNWSPAAVARPIVEGDQYCFFRTEAIEADERDTWQTPKIIIDLCREALGGGIDLDPASSAKANEIVGAEFFHTEKDDGLKHPWAGRVFLNPPYGGTDEAGADIFTRKLIDEIRLGNTIEAITILNLQSMPTKWFPRISENASAHGIARKRIGFLGPRPKSGKGTRYGASKNGTVFSYFGPNHERFFRIFSPYAYCFALWELN